LKELRVVTVCGMGMGTAILLKMLVEKCCQKLGVNCTIEVGNVAIAGSFKDNYDIIVAGSELKDNLSHVGLPLVLVSSFINEESCLLEMKKVLSREFNYKPSEKAS